MKPAFRIASIGIVPPPVIFGQAIVFEKELLLVVLVVLVKEV